MFKNVKSPKNQKNNKKSKKISEKFFCRKGFHFFKFCSQVGAYIKLLVAKTYSFALLLELLLFHILCCNLTRLATTTRESLLIVENLQGGGGKNEKSQLS